MKRKCRNCCSAMYVQKGVQIFLYYNVVTCYNFSFRFRVFVEINFSKKKNFIFPSMEGANRYTYKNICKIT